MLTDFKWKMVTIAGAWVAGMAYVLSRQWTNKLFYLLCFFFYSVICPGVEILGIFGHWLENQKKNGARFMGVFD
jgi:formylmethanofuran dehydrogenase subunit E-like metal-binding protein